MKRLILYISIFFLTSLSNSISAPIKLLGLDATMDIKTAEDILKKQNYICNNVMDVLINCKNADKFVQVAKKHILFNCHVYRGCNAKSTEVVKFFESELKFKIRNPETSDIFDTAFCGEGPDGDKFCVKYDQLNDIGPSLLIIKHKLGDTGMSLN